MAKISQNDGVQQISVKVDIKSEERGGDDSVSADINAQNTLTGAGTDQKTVSGILSETDEISYADRPKLFALLTASKLFGEDPDGNLKILQVDDSGYLKLSGHIPRYAEGEVTAANNTNGLTVDLQVDGRPNIEIYYNVSSPATLEFYGSNDGSNWYPKMSPQNISGEDNIRYIGNADKYIRVRVPDTSIDIALKVRAGR